MKWAECHWNWATSPSFRAGGMLFLIRSNKLLNKYLLKANYVQVCGDMENKAAVLMKHTLGDGKIDKQWNK